MNETVVAQMHRTLVDAMRRSRPGALDQPVTVAEIYQELLPYRDARTAVGFDMNADYEHALLRLLAGEEELARIEPREVRDKLRLELESPNPDVGLFRTYANCDVWVSTDGSRLDMDADDHAIAASWEEEFLRAEAEDEADAEEVPPLPGARSGSRFEIAGEPAVGPDIHEGPAIVTSGCAFCGAELPDSRMIHFCPYCGSDQSQQPCPSCGEMLEPLWRFCINCGARARPLGDHVN
jgi:hypothetical protein